MTRFDFLSIKGTCLLCLACIFSCTTVKKDLPEVYIQEEENQWVLYRDGSPYFIKGAVGTDFMDRLQKYGANSVRIWQDYGISLRQADTLGMTALISLPVRAERRGMDYDDPEMVKNQFDEIMSLVNSLKSQPGILMWAIGNELDFVPGSETYKKSVWNAVNDIAKSIKETDPDHPVMTVVGTGRFQKIKDIIDRAPDLDLLGVNTYADMSSIPEKLGEYGWEKPYVFTEWGVSGYWQRPATSWGVPYEENTTVKAEIYREKYRDVINEHLDQCFGSYVFLWGWKQEHTHTWFGMLDSEGNESEAVGVMYEMWTGKKPINQAPRIDSLIIDGTPYLDDVSLAPGSMHEAEVIAGDPDGDAIIFVWEIRPEADYADYAGQGEKIPEVIEGLVEELGREKINFITPEKAGAYRIYVFLYDGENHYATANKPFYVGNPS